MGLRGRELASPGDGHRQSWAKAISVPPSLAARSRRAQIQRHGGVRPSPAAAPGTRFSGADRGSSALSPPGPGLSLRLLDVGLFRVGSDRYARDNQHYGLTTLLSNQLTIRNQQAVFDYLGKAGRRQRLSITDPEAVAVLATATAAPQRPCRALGLPRTSRLDPDPQGGCQQLPARRGGGTVLRQGVPNVERHRPRRRHARERASSRFPRRRSGIASRRRGPG